VVVNFPEECASSLFHTNRDTTAKGKGGKVAGKVQKKIGQLKQVLGH
jgi:hypothetical protein